MKFPLPLKIPYCRKTITLAAGAIKEQLQTSTQRLEKSAVWVNLKRQLK